VFATLATVSGAVAEHGLRPPAVVVMGDVVAVARQLAAGEPALSDLARS
jgi:siroheme synthase